MVLTPELLRTFERDMLQANCPERTPQLIETGMIQQRDRLMALTGDGVVPGTPQRTLSKEERDRRRELRRAVHQQSRSEGAPAEGPQ